VPVVANAVGTGLPASFLDVYGTAGLIALAAGGMVIALAGALIPAGWAAASRTAWVLRAE
jgi:putative ABC transport system permease protein